MAIPGARVVQAIGPRSETDINNLARRRFALDKVAR